MCASRRPAVGSSDWLGLVACLRDDDSFGVRGVLGHACDLPSALPPLYEKLQCSCCVGDAVMWTAMYENAIKPVNVHSEYWNPATAFAGATLLNKLDGGLDIGAGNTGGVAIDDRSCRSAGCEREQR